MIIVKNKNIKIAPTNDFVFKRIFGHVGNEEITKGFVSSIIGRELTSINLEGNTILEKSSRDEKSGILDIKATLDSNILCDIEMQMCNNKNIEKRMLYYWSKLYSGSIKSGQDFKSLKKTISILIANFELDSLSKIPDFHTVWEIREKKHQNTVLTNVFELHIIELRKLEKALKNKYIEDYNKKLAIWSKFLLNPDSLEVVEMQKNRDIQLAKKELDRLRDELINLGYESLAIALREKAENEIRNSEEYGFDKGLKQGLEQGKKFEKIETAKKLLNSGMSIKEIIKITELTKEDLENI